MSRQRSIYLRIMRMISPFAVIGLRLYTVVTRHPRVRVVLLNERREVLLVKNVLAIHDRWVLPGGGVNFREAPEEAARREIHEETGISIPLDKLHVVRTVQRVESELPYVAIILSAACKRADLPEVLYNPREIAVAQWFSVTELPLEMNDFTRQAITTVTAV